MQMAACIKLMARILSLRYKTGCASVLIVRLPLSLQMLKWMLFTISSESTGSLLAGHIRQTERETSAQI